MFRSVYIWNENYSVYSVRSITTLNFRYNDERDTSYRFWNKNIFNIIVENKRFTFNF